MINRRHLAHWTLVAVATVSTIATGYAGWKLSQTNSINEFISDPSSYEEHEADAIPEHKKAQFAQAFYDAENGNTEKALSLLTNAVTTDDTALEAAAYFNRANINLREAIALPIEDTSRLALVGLAKQDYRNALLVDSSFWEARYNLEYALLMVPEETPELGVSEWGKKGSSRVIVKVVGFRVDLP